VSDVTPGNVRTVHGRSRDRRHRVIDRRHRPEIAAAIGEASQHFVCPALVSDIAVFVLKRDVKLQPTNQPYAALAYWHSLPDLVDKRNLIHPANVHTLTINHNHNPNPQP